MSVKSLARTPLFLLVRDPRDCQISWYHARHLHQQDGTESVILEDATIHEDLIRDESFDADVTSLLDWCELSGGRIFRYEDMVMNPLAFILEFADFSSLPLKRSAIDLALIQASFFQPALDRTNHNRSGMPYQALRTLSPSELKKLNDRFGPLLTRLGYPLKPKDAPELDLATLIQRDASKRYIQSLAEENGLRISEIAEVKKEVALFRSEAEQLMRDLPEQNGLRILEIAALRESLDTIRSDVAQSIRDLPEQNWMRIMEIAALKQDVTSLRSEVDQLKRLLLNQVDIHRRATA